MTPEGIERDLAVSYLSRFVILNEIASRSGKDRPRTSQDHPEAPDVRHGISPGTEQKADVDDLNSELSYKRFAAHSNTVAGNEVLVLEAARRFANVDIFGLNPGFVKTGIRANLLGSRTLVAVIEWLTSFMMVEPDAYAERLVPLLVSPDLNGRSGVMFNNKAQAILPEPVVHGTILRDRADGCFRQIGRSRESGLGRSRTGRDCAPSRQSRSHSPVQLK